MSKWQKNFTPSENINNGNEITDGDSLTSSTINEIANNTFSNNTQLTSHINSQNNPHRVTADQVGAYSKTETDDKIKQITGVDAKPIEIYNNNGGAYTSSVELTYCGIYEVSIVIYEDGLGNTTELKIIISNHKKQNGTIIEYPVNENYELVYDDGLGGITLRNKIVGGLVNAISQVTLLYRFI